MKSMVSRSFGLLLLAPTLALSLAATGRAPLVVPAANFQRELGYRTVTATTFAGVPLASHDSVTRAKVLTAFARCHDAELHSGAVFEDAVAGEDVNGVRRGQDQAAYDWQRDGQRVACKSAQLKWDGNTELWTLQFQNVKLAMAGGRDAAFDELLLAAYTPEGVHLFQHDLRAGVTTSGVSTAAAGKQIKFYGPSHEPDWRVALGEIRGKMVDKGCRPLVSARFDEPRLAAAIAETPLPLSASAFEGVPLVDCSGTLRGGVLSRLVRRLDEGWLHADATFEEAVAGEDVDGKRRGQNSAAYDWQRDGRRVACKSAGLRWNRGNECWMLQFSAVKLATAGGRDAAFDELLLAAYTPEGVHLLRHDGLVGVGTSGVSTAATGKSITFIGPSHEPDWRVALGEIRDKMQDKGCRPLAFVPWDELDGTV